MTIKDRLRKDSYLSAGIYDLGKDVISLFVDYIDIDGELNEVDHEEICDLLRYWRKIYIAQMRGVRGFLLIGYLSDDPDPIRLDTLDERYGYFKTSPDGSYSELVLKKDRILKNILVISEKGQTILLLTEMI